MRRKPRRQYRIQVRSSVPQVIKTDSALRSASALIVGEEFRSWVWEKCVEKGEEAARAEDVLFRREIALLDKEKVLGVTCRHLGVRRSDLRERKMESILRAVAARTLVKYAGLTHRQVAEALGMKAGVSASLQVLKANRLKVAGRSTARIILGLEEELNA